MFLRHSIYMRFMDTAIEVQNFRNGTKVTSTRTLELHLPLIGISHGEKLLNSYSLLHHWAMSLYTTHLRLLTFFLNIKCFIDIHQNTYII